MKCVIGIFLGVKRGRCVGLTTLLSASRMSENVGASTSRKPNGLHGLYRKNFTFYLTIDSLLMLNFALVRCKLEHASVARTPAVLRCLVRIRASSVTGHWLLSSRERNRIELLLIRIRISIFIGMSYFSIM
jgi:hypothetical protein